MDDLAPIELRIESTVVLGSLAKGPDPVLQILVNSGVCPILLNGTHEHSSPIKILIHFNYNFLSVLLVNIFS